MDPDDSPLRLPDALAVVTKQDLDPLSTAELEMRIAVLEGEIVRTRRHMERAATHRASANALFKR